MLSFSETLQVWNSGQYGRALRFCDQRTFAKVRSLWASHSSKHLAPQEKLDRQNRFRATIDKARAAKKQMMGKSISISGVRSATPTGIQALYDLPNIHSYFWEHGTVNIDESSNKQPKNLNPAFASSPNQALTLHYGLGPLLGFHLATAYVPLTPHSPLCLKTQQAPSIRMLARGRPTAILRIEQIFPEICYRRQYPPLLQRRCNCVLPHASASRHNCEYQ